MLFLWDQERPISVSEMMEAWSDKAWTKNYTRDIVRALEQKGAIEFCGLVRCGSQYARRFRTILSREEYYSQLANRRGVSVSKMFKAQAVAMVEKGDKDGMAKLIQELEDIIEEYRIRDDGEE